jgi:cystathionine beta-lyase
MQALLCDSDGAVVSRERIELRRTFLEACAAETIAIQRPILDLGYAKGRLNPAGLGQARELSGFLVGQTTVAFDTVGDYRDADKKGKSKYGGAEYGIVETPESARVCQEFSRLHGGSGAVILPSGLSAIETVFKTFLKSPDGKPTVLIPDNRYFPTERVLNDMAQFNPNLHIRRYPGNVTGRGIENLIKDIQSADKRRINLLYLEAPGSQTFEIPELKEIIRVAKEYGIPTAMDNSWASHVRFQPLAHGVDVVIQSTTKYEGGYADTPSGIVVAGDKKHFEALARNVRVSGNGAVDSHTCNRLFGRVASTGERLDQHYNSALKVMEWLQQQKFTGQILCPALPGSPDHDRFKEYFGKGNGLFTLVFREDIKPEQVDQFMDSTNLFRIGESWGGHVSLLLPTQPTRKLSELPRGQMVRFSIGLENPNDIVRDLEQASVRLG